MHRLLRRDERAPGIDTVSEAAPAPAATSNDTVPLRPPAQAAAREPIAPTSVPNVAPTERSRASIAPPQSASPLIASTTDAVANAALPPTQAPRDKSPTALPQHPIPQAYGWSGARAKSSALAPAKQASTTWQSSAKLAHAPSTGAPTASYAQSPTQAPRVHASWASLEPPAWLRGGPGPGEPPSVKTRESRVARVASTETVSAVATPAATAPAVATMTRIELAQPSPALDVAPPAAGPQPVSAGASLAPADPSVAASAAGDPRGNAVASPVRQPSRSASRGAPVEDRSESLKLALTPALSAPEPASRTAAVDPNAQDDFAGQARRTLADAVPRIARQTEREATRVLLMAASAYQPQQERSVADAARLSGIRSDLSLLPATTAPREARRFNDQARVALASRHSVAEALDLQLRAFGANPRDAEVAGHLALLYLKLTPPQADTARQVALLALANGAQQRSTRMEDWYAFAVASALSGRDVDARNALFVMLAVSGNTERSCLAALNALARYGERLRGPVEAVFSRIHGQGRDDESPACAWPPNLSVLSKLP
ncbi:MAG: hypothetical protein E6H53_12945 [Betaproteobacteria bacterium]|nr:MAG: hypothetical protein E6H53_12945 [Betaproteobacteria bacterium]